MRALDLEPAAQNPRIEPKLSGYDLGPADPADDDGEPSPPNPDLTVAEWRICNAASQAARDAVYAP
jgi:hypothetical protein